LSIGGGSLGGGGGGGCTVVGSNEVECLPIELQSPAWFVVGKCDIPSLGEGLALERGPEVGFDLLGLFKQGQG